MLRITHRGRTTRALLLWVLCFAGVSASANKLEPLSDQEMGAVSGAGLALALDNFQFALSPYSYMEQVGSAPSNACSPTNTTDCWRRGDLRWYGVNISGAGTGGSHWDEAA
ncbi:MAG: hypothetical protein ACPG43_11390, partial [Alcanivoracaceae bacterium]